MPTPHVARLRAARRLLGRYEDTGVFSFVEEARDLIVAFRNELAHDDSLPPDLEPGQVAVLRLGLGVAALSLRGPGKDGAGTGLAVSSAWHALTEAEFGLRL